MTPKDYIVYIEKGSNETRAVLDTHEGMDVIMHEEGHKIIGYVSADREKAAVEYGDQVLR
jgi:hypothetical protein